MKMSLAPAAHRCTEPSIEFDHDQLTQHLPEGGLIAGLGQAGVRRYLK